MFSYVFMKILEGRPRSYEKIMNKASSGKVLKIKQSVAALVPEGARVLEIGCGTGELAVMCLARGADVDGFDLNPAMIQVAKERIASGGLESKFSVRQMGVDGMDGFAEAAYDTVLATLVFSELSDDERHYALKHAFRVLKAGGRTVIADEVVPGTFAKKMLHALVRAPMMVTTFLVSGHTTRPVADLAGELTAAGFTLEKDERSHGDAFALVVGIKKENRQVSASL